MLRLRISREDIDNGQVAGGSSGNNSADMGDDNNNSKAYSSAMCPLSANGDCQVQIMEITRVDKNIFTVDAELDCYSNILRRDRVAVSACESSLANRALSLINNSNREIYSCTIPWWC